MHMDRQKLSHRKKSIIELTIVSMCFIMLILSSTVMAYGFANTDMFATSNETSKGDKIYHYEATAGVFAATNKINTLTGFSTDDNKSTVTGSSIDTPPVLVETGTGVINETTNIYMLPDVESEVLGTLYWNEYIEYTKYNDEWFRVDFGTEDLGYIEAKYITSDIESFDYSTSKDVSGDKRKSYMDYRTITCKSSPQYKIQKQYAYTNYDGIRMAEGRFLVAIGSYFNAEVGRCIDVELADGSIMPCIVGDAKRNEDTNASNMIGKDGSTVEFIVDQKALESHVKEHGDISAITDFSEKVVRIHIYDRNILDD